MGGVRLTDAPGFGVKPETAPIFLSLIETPPDECLNKFSSIFCNAIEVVPSSSSSITSKFDFELGVAVPLIIESSVGFKTPE